MDREKVIKALEYCRNQAGCWSDESECPWLAECRKDVNSLKDATLTLLKEQEETIYTLQVELASSKEIAEGYSVLLKEQEPVKPILKREGKSKRYNDYVCPVCDEIVVYEQNFCSECGKPLNWD